jgi:tRNA threonylcarbamoyladenosine biosynthesis protein TsaB
VIVLALDTATPQVGVAVAGPDGPLASLHLIEGRRHGEVLAPAVETVCRLAGVGLPDVGLIAVDVGPGLFTGLRVGISTAAALGHALGRRVCGVMSTDILAAPHTDARRPVAAVVDIRRGEVAWALYAGGAVLRPAQVATPAALAADLGSVEGPVLAVGDGARRYAADLPGVEVAGATHAHPSAVELAAIAAARADEAVDASSLVPRYLREADVRIGWEQAARG